MATRMLQRRGTAAAWLSQNPVLGAGELGFETDTKVIKMGDGVTPWNSLLSSYLNTGGGQLTGILDMNGNAIVNQGAFQDDLDLGNNDIVNVGDILNPGNIGPLSGALDLDGNALLNPGPVGGALDMNGNLIQDLANPTADDEAVNYQSSAKLLETNTLGSDFTGLQGNKTQWLALSSILIPANHAVLLQTTFTVRIGTGAAFTINHYLQSGTTELLGTQHGSTRTFESNEKIAFNLHTVFLQGGSSSNITFNIRTGSDISSNPFRVLGGGTTAARLTAIDLGLVI